MSWRILGATLYSPMGYWIPGVVAGIVLCLFIYAVADYHFTVDVMNGIGAVFWSPYLKVLWLSSQRKVILI